MHALGVVGAIGWEVLDRIRFGDAFAVSPHGLGIALGYLAGSYVFLFEGRRRGIPEDQGSSMVLWALVGAIVGSRFFYVLAHFGEPGLETIADVFAVYRGGISLIGGIFGAIAFAYPVLRRHRVPFLTAMDPAVFGIGLGIIIGRVGDLIIGDHLGKPTSWLLAFTYEGGTLSGYNCSVVGRCVTSLAGGQIQEIGPNLAQLRSSSGQILAEGFGVHQTALYDYVSTMALVLLLLYLNRRHIRTGWLTLTFGAWYGTVRIVTDFLRVDKRFYGLTGSQWASVLVLSLCVATAIRFATQRDLAAPAVGSDADGPSGGSEDDGPSGDAAAALPGNEDDGPSRGSDRAPPGS